MLSKEELRQLKHQFVWFFNGENNVSTLFKSDIYLFVDVLYEKYVKELNNIIEIFKDGIEDSSSEDFFSNLEINGWFSDISKLKFLSKEDFCLKIKENSNFSAIWGDLGVTDQLELRNWGINLGYDKNDDAFIKQKGFDQILSLVESLKIKPNSEEHIITFFNPTNKEFRLTPSQLYFLNFHCVELSYKERIEWFLIHYYETGMEFEILLDSFKDKNLDGFIHYDETISIPKFKLNLNITKSKMQNKKQIEFNYYFFLLFLKVIAKHCNMTEGSIGFSNNKISKSIIDQKISLKVLNTNQYLKLSTEDILIEN